MASTKKLSQPIPYPEDAPTVSFLFAAECFQIGRTTAYAMLRDRTFPVPTASAGRKIIVRTADLRRALGLTLYPPTVIQPSDLEPTLRTSIVERGD